MNHFNNSQNFPSLPLPAWCRWLVEPLSGEITPKSLWLWWERRRFAYNLFVVVIAIFSLAAFYFFCGTSGKLRPGEDAEELLGLMFGIIAGPVIWNLAYCLGPAAEIVLRKCHSERTYGPLLLELAFGFSALLISFPAIFWAVIWIWQALHGFPKDY